MGEAKGSRDLPFKPVVHNRNEVNPFDLIRQGKGTLRDCERAIVLMDRAFEAQINQFAMTQQGLAEREWALRSYLVAEKEWRALPFWRRWKTPRPTIPLFKEFKEPETAKMIVADEEAMRQTAEHVATHPPFTADEDKGGGT